MNPELAVTYETLEMPAAEFVKTKLWPKICPRKRPRYAVTLLEVRPTLKDVRTRRILEAASPFGFQIDRPLQTTEHEVARKLRDKFIEDDLPFLVDVEFDAFGDKYLTFCHYSYLHDLSDREVKFVRRYIELAARSVATVRVYGHRAHRLAFELR